MIKFNKQLFKINQYQKSVCLQKTEMYNQSSTNNTIGQLSPWNTKQNIGIISLFPQIYVKKIKKKENKENYCIAKDNLKKRNQLEQLSSLMQIKQEKLSFKGKKHQQRTVNEPNGHQFNFIKRFRNKQYLQNPTIRCSKPLKSQKDKYNLPNFIPLSDLINKKFTSGNASSLLQIKNSQDFKRDLNFKDVHSLYLMQNLKGISKTNLAIRNKLEYENSDELSNNSFFKNTVNKNSKRQKQLKLSTQRTNRDFSVKTQGSENYLCMNMNFPIKENKKYDSYLTQRKQTQNCRLYQNSIKNKMHQRDNTNFIIENVFYQGDNEEKAQNKKSKQVQKGSMLLLEHKNMNKIVRKQNKPSNKFTQIKIYPTAKHQWIKPQSSRNQQLQGISSSLRIEKQMKKNLRKLRGQLVKMTRDQHLVEGKISEEDVYVDQEKIMQAKKQLAVSE